MTDSRNALPLEDLLQRLRDEADDLEHIREEVLRRSTSLVERIISSDFSSAGFAAEELFRPGYLGLLNAVYNFNLSRGKSFEEYASNLIKGEIRQHIRDQVRQTSVPKWMKDLNRQIEVAEARLLRETGKLPSLSTLADTVNITEEGLAEVFKAREAMGYVSLNAEMREHDPVFEIDTSKIRSKSPAVFPMEYRIRLASALERLADLQQYLLQNLFRPSAE